MSIPLQYDEPGYARQVQNLLVRAPEPQQPSPVATRLAVGALALGVLGFVAGIFYAPGRAWGAFDANFLFWVGLAQCGVIGAAVFNTGFARWGRTVGRITELLGAFLPFTPILYAILWLGHNHLFMWTHMSNRSPWLVSISMFWRDEFVLFCLLALSLWWLYNSLRPDVKKMSERWPATDRFQQWLIRDWKGDEHEYSWSQAVLRNLGPGFIIAFVWGFSMLDIDLGMTVDPKFKSTMFPGIYWAQEYVAAMALCSVLLMLWRRRSPIVRDLVTSSNVMDLANLVWGFAIFRTWFDWSQYIIIWYGNLPDEAKYLIDRWRTHPFNWLAWLSLWFLFIAPFLYGFSRSLKRSPVGAAILGGMVLIGALSREFVDVIPSIHPLGPHDFGLIELAITIGWAGAVALPYLWLAPRVPLFPVSDPLFHKAVKTRGIPET